LLSVLVLTGKKNFSFTSSSTQHGCSVSHPDLDEIQNVAKDTISPYQSLNHSAEDARLAQPKQFKMFIFGIYLQIESFLFLTTKS